MKTLRLETDARGVARVTLARGEQLNVFDEAMIAEITEVFVALHADPAVRVVVLAAEGKMFCAGADIQWMKRQSEATVEQNLEDARRFAEMLRAVHECRRPVIACVQGHAYGGGVGLTAAADIALAARGARFAVTEARFGILPSAIGPYLIHAVGARQARRLSLTMTSLDADDACRLGLVHEVAAPGELAARAETVVEELLAAGPQAQAEIKALYARLNGAAIDAEVRELTAQTIARVRATDEAREGFAAFLAKRPAPWKPR